LRGPRDANLLRCEKGRIRVKKVAVNPAEVGRPAGNYSQSVRVVIGDSALLFISGQVALGLDGQLVGEGDVGRQSEQVFANLERILAAHGASFADAVRIGTFFVAGVDREPYLAVRARYLPDPPPASTTVFVSQLVRPEWLVEVELTAAFPADRVPPSD
jgi:2-iminobutanoate/2-iminopropanoate deaminase